MIESVEILTANIRTIYLISVNETLDDMLEDSGDEEETNGIVNKVLDEIGIEISGKVISILLFDLIRVVFICISFT